MSHDFKDAVRGELARRLLIAQSSDDENDAREAIVTPEGSKRPQIFSDEDDFLDFGPAASSQDEVDSVRPGRRSELELRDEITANGSQEFFEDSGGLAANSETKLTDPDLPKPSGSLDTAAEPKLEDQNLPKASGGLDTAAEPKLEDQNLPKASGDLDTATETKLEDPDLPKASGGLDTAAETKLEDPDLPKASGGLDTAAETKLKDQDLPKASGGLDIVRETQDISKGASSPKTSSGDSKAVLEKRDLVRPLLMAIAQMFRKLLLQVKRRRNQRNPFPKERRELQKKNLLLERQQ